MLGEEFKNKWKTLNNEWQSLKQSWNDPVQKGFEKQFWQDIEKSILPVTKLLIEMEETIQDAKKIVRKN